MLSPSPAKLTRLNFTRRARKDLDNILPAKLAEKVEHDNEVVVARLAHDGIIEAVDKFKPDLLVMSSHGFSGFQKFLLGSTTDKVMRSVECPVLLIKATACNTDE